MFILPYAHERQTVQRLPYVTFALIAINLIVFLFTNYAGPSGEETDKALYDFDDYLFSHPYLEVPKKMEKHFTKEKLEQIHLMKEATDTSNISQLIIDQEQAELQRLADKVLSLVQEDPFRKYGYVPDDSHFLNLFTCLFLHTGWLHLIGNMFFLYLAGCSIEDLWGRPLYVAFYLLSGIVATVTHDLKFSTSDVPIVGASGAIAGLMGAFLIRLYNTKISFFYMIFIWYRGTFKAPAFVMLPLWLLQQVWDASLVGQMASVAFWAHIGGFIFGALFAAGMKFAQVEEKYIAPSIEKKVSLAQNPDFLRAMELSEKGAYPEALILLEKVVRQEPNHLDAYMEMRRIAKINRDYHLYTKYSAAMFDILIRSRDWDFLLDVYRQFMDFPGRQALPARTIFGLGSYFEESQDFDSAVDRYEELVSQYPDDPLTMKVHGKLARLYLEKYSNRDRGIEHFGKAYYHKNSSDPWQASLMTDMRRFNIPLPQKQEAPPASESAIAPSEAHRYETADRSLPDEEESAPVAAAIVSIDEIEPAMIDEVSHGQKIEPPPDSPERVLLPHTAFDEATDDNWAVVPCHVEKMTLKGLILRNKHQVPGFLPWTKIQFVSVGRIRMTDPSSHEAKDFLVFDMITRKADTRRAYVLYRTRSHELAFDKIFPRVDQSFSEAYQNFVGILLSNSGARPMPSHENCVGPRFASYADLDRYDARIKEKVMSPQS